MDYLFIGFQRTYQGEENFWTSFSVTEISILDFLGYFNN